MTRQQFIKNAGILTLLSPIFANMELFAKTSNPLPAIFIGHGSPMNAIENNEFTKGWQEIANRLVAPTAILCISAHWETNGTKITAMEKPKTIYDFYGFPEELYKIKYEATGSPLLAKDIIDKNKITTINADYEWGLDHGCWSVLNKMYPKADIPVLQLSINTNVTLQQHIEIARDLNKLRHQGVLILGSGNMVHNLRLIDWKNQFSGFDWAIEANEGIKKWIITKDLKALSFAPQHSLAFRKAIPTLEHYIPLIYIMALQENDETVRLFNDKLVMGSISMTSLILEKK